MTTQKDISKAKERNDKAYEEYRKASIGYTKAYTKRAEAESEERIAWVQFNNTYIEYTKASGEYSNLLTKRFTKKKAIK